MGLQRQHVDLKTFLQSEIPWERLSAPVREKLDAALRRGGPLREIAVEVVGELMQRGVLKEVGRLRKQGRSIRLWSVEGSPRAYDLRGLIPGPAAAAPGGTSGEALPPSSSAGGAGRAVSPSPTGGAPEETPLSPRGSGALSEGAQRTLGAIRRTFQRDWVSFGLDASLENLLIALRESLGDPSLHLLLWAERLPLQTGGGQGWEVVDPSHPLVQALARNRGAVIPAHGLVMEGRRWWPVWLGDEQVGALGGDLTLDPRLGDEAAGAVRDLLAAAARSQHRVFTDPLTGVHNRGSFQRQFPVEMERSRRSGAPLALLFADIDHFKRINDEYGHEAGDTVLRQLASLLVAHLRRIDYVFRFGGEEFTLLLPGTDLKEAAHTAERLRAQIASTGVKLPDGRRLDVTLSIGVAVFPEHGEDERVLLRRADLAMYQAKQAGRNRIVIWGQNGS